MRLGELLVQFKAISPADLEAGLRSQREYPGRLGTRLVELGLTDLDTIARALGRQHGHPPTLDKHVAAIDPRTVARIPRQLCLQHRVVPIGFTATTPARLVIASTDPWKVPLEEFAFAAGCRVEAWIAPERRIEECLERLFGETPTARGYVAMTYGTNERVVVEPEVDDVAVSPPLRSMAKARPTLEMPSVVPAIANRSSAPPDDKARDEAARLEAERRVEAEIAAAQAERAAQLQARAHLSDLSELAPASARPADDAKIDDEWDIPESAGSAVVEALAEARLSQPPRPLTAPPDVLLHAVIDRAEAVRLLALTTSKDEVGQILVDWLRSTFGCGLVLLVKDGTALGWKGFFSTASTELVEAVAVSLASPTMLSAAHDSREPFLGPPPAAGAALQSRLWKMLGAQPPTEVLVAPVVLGKRVVNLIYAHAEGGYLVSPSALEDATALCLEAAEAYKRIVRLSK